MGRRCNFLHLKISKIHYQKCEKQKNHALDPFWTNFVPDYDYDYYGYGDYRGGYADPYYDDYYGYDDFYEGYGYGPGPRGRGRGGPPPPPPPVGEFSFTVFSV